MSEHEGALFDAVLALAATVLEMGANPQALRAKLDAARNAADTLGNRHSVETMEFLISSLFPSADPPSKPSFRIV
jgi:hypothetical protein